MSHYRAIYLQHGADCGPFRTESVPFRYRMNADPAMKPGPIRTYWQIKAAGRWRWIMCPDRGGPYVVIDRQRVRVSFELAVDA